MGNRVNNLLPPLDVLFKDISKNSGVCIGVYVGNYPMVFGTHDGAIAYLNTNGNGGLVQIFPPPEDCPARIQAMDYLCLSGCICLVYGSSRGDVKVRFKFS